jgi:hypothetical protein
VETPFFVEKLLSGDGIDVTGDLARALMASQEESRNTLGDWKIIFLASASATWTTDGLVPTDITG